MPDDHDSPDAPITGATTGRLPFGSPRFARLVQSPVARRLSPRRLVFGVAVGGLLVWGLIEAGTRATVGLTGWVGALPEHQIPFEQIELDPPPPLYIRQGAAGILASVRAEAKYPESISTLDTDLEALRVALTRNPWIEGADSIRTSYQHLRARVIYRRAVAVVVPIGEERRVVVDRHGVELPSSPSQFDWAEQRPRYKPAGTTTPLIEIRGVNREQPDRIGLEWVSTRPEVDAGRVVQAARLAGFLADRIAAEVAGGKPALDLAAIYFYHREEVGFFVLDSRQNWIYWKSAPGTEGIEEPKAAEKWAQLSRFVAARPAGELKLNPDEFLWFSPRDREARSMPFLRGGRSRKVANRPAGDDSSGRSPASPSR